MFLSAQFNLIFEFGNFFVHVRSPYLSRMYPNSSCASVTQQRTPKLFVNGFPTHHSNSPIPPELEKIKIQRFIILLFFPHTSISHTPSNFFTHFPFWYSSNELPTHSRIGGGAGVDLINPAVSHTKVAHYNNNNRGGPFWYGKLTRVKQQKKRGRGRWWSDTACYMHANSRMFSGIWICEKTLLHLYFKTFFYIYCFRQVSLSTYFSRELLKRRKHNW